jgi:small subunit ribosomal protein S7
MSEKDEKLETVAPETVEKVPEEPKDAAPSSEEDVAGSAAKKGAALLFMHWPFDKVEVTDLGLKKYLNLKEIMIPHSGGRHEHKRFWKSNISFIERFANKIMSPGIVERKIKGRGASSYAGKKAKILTIIEKAFSVVELKTGKNPIQVLVDAIIHAAPREETTRIALGGITYQQAVDVAPQRRIDMAIKFIVQGAIRAVYNNVKTVEECFADEIIAASNDDNNASGAIKRKEELERIAISAR